MLVYAEPQNPVLRQARMRAATATSCGPCDAATLLRIAKVLGVRGELVKRVRGGRELRAYLLPRGWENTRILARADQHPA